MGKTDLVWVCSKHAYFVDWLYFFLIMVSRVPSLYFLIGSLGVLGLFCFVFCVGIFGRLAIGLCMIELLWTHNSPS